MIDIPYDAYIAIHNASIKVGVDEKILLAIAKNESNFDRFPKSNKLKASNTGCRGMFQIEGETWAGLRGAVPYSIDKNEQAYTEALYIKQLMKKYDNNMYLVTIALDGGPGVSNFILKWGKAIGNNAAIMKAVSFYHDIEEKKHPTRKVLGFGIGKVKEILDYPKKFNDSLQAVGGPVNLTASLSDNNETTSSPNNWYDVSTNKDIKQSISLSDINNKNPFIINLFAANSSGVDDLNKITPEIIGNSKLVTWIREGLVL